MAANKKIKLLLRSLLSSVLILGIALGVMLGVSGNQFIKALWASWLLTPVEYNVTSFSDYESSHKFRRQIQKHYMQYGLYIPLEDIIAVNLLDNSQARLNFLMRNACGQAKLYVWVPLKLPFQAV